MNTPNAICKGCGNHYYMPSQPEDLGDYYCDNCLTNGDNYEQE